MRSSPSFPPDISLPLTMCDDSAHLFYRICEVQIYIHDKVIVLPLLHKGTYILRIIPPHIALEQGNFIYINTDKAILCFDRNRQYYILIDEAEMEV